MAKKNFLPVAAEHDTDFGVGGGGGRGGGFRGDSTEVTGRLKGLSEWVALPKGIPNDELLL